MPPKTFAEIAAGFCAPVPRGLPEKPPRPTNCVYTVYLKHHQNLALLPDHDLNTKRNDSHFASTNIKFVNPSSTMLLFAPGKLVSVGSMTRNMGLYSLVVVRQRILELGSLAEFDRPSVSNIVMSADLGHFVDMASFVADNEPNCNYVPKKFSGCSYNPNGLDLDLKNELDDNLPAHKRRKKEKAVIFEKGKVNFMGLSSYQNGNTLSVQTFAALEPYICEVRNRGKGVVQQRLAELQEARKRKADEEDHEAKRVKLDAPDLQIL